MTDKPLREAVYYVFHKPAAALQNVAAFFKPLHPHCPRDASEITPRCPLHHVQKVLIFRHFYNPFP